MTEPQTTRREATDPFGEWASSKDVLMSYRYLASAPRPIDRTHAENALHLRRDLRTAGGAMLAAPLAIAMLDAAGVNVDPVNILALTQINLTVIDHGQGIDDVFMAGRVATEARSQIFTEAVIHHASDRERIVGFGSANWSVICPTPEGFAYPEPGAGVDESDDLPPLWQAYTGNRRADGLLEIPGLRPEIGAERLHHGPMLVVTEAAAIDAGSRALGTDDVGVDQLTMTIVAPGRTGPFVAMPVSVGTSGDSAACRIELRDNGRAGRVVATCVVRISRLRRYLHGG
ncbi:hypothetical protein [Mycobacterium deserti]|uniref:Dehydrogenase (DH) domain-containing protein n=1 Tax=Mycobacterium deserti TaxID=2978347 RepID=A0ABT2M4K5_9MYCO|nr:hypothetical protein [Mycobacterium deserti]MCT7657201.1 hypothetical protein [Mycobacterium deserti]